MFEPEKIASLTLLLLGLFLTTTCRNQPREADSGNKPHSETSQSYTPKSQAGSETGNFDYYVLALSWAPEFCATHSENASSRECDPDRHFGFVVHGMWPQNDNGTFPLNCGSGPPISQSTVRRLLDIIPSRGLIQHEWRTHGTCTGLDPDDYFAKVASAYNKLQIPPQYKAVAQPQNAAPADIDSEFAKANGAPTSAVHVACSGDDLLGVDLCLTKDLQYRSCGSGLRDCRARQVLIRPVP